MLYLMSISTQLSDNLLREISFKYLKYTFLIKLKGRVLFHRDSLLSMYFRLIPTATYLYFHFKCPFWILDTDCLMFNLLKLWSFFNLSNNFLILGLAAPIIWLKLLCHPSTTLFVLGKSFTIKGKLNIFHTVKYVIPSLNADLF